MSIEKHCTLGSSWWHVSVTGEDGVGFDVLAGFMSEDLADIFIDAINHLANQEPLGEQFQKVLNDNIWELYGS